MVTECHTVSPVEVPGSYRDPSRTMQSTSLSRVSRQPDIPASHGLSIVNTVNRGNRSSAVILYPDSGSGSYTEAHIPEFKICYHDFKMVL